MISRRQFLCLLARKPESLTRFAEAYNRWIEVRHNSGPYRIDAREIQLWGETKKYWKQLRFAIDQFYRQ